MPLSTQTARTQARTNETKQTNLPFGLTTQLPIPSRTTRRMIKNLMRIANNWKRISIMRQCKWWLRCFVEPICWIQLLRLSVERANNLDMICWHPLLNIFIEVNSWHDLLQQLLEINCWDDMICWDHMLRLSDDLNCWLCVDFICWDQVLKSSVLLPDSKKMWLGYDLETNFPKLYKLEIFLKHST